MDLEVGDIVVWTDIPIGEHNKFNEQYEFVTDPNTFELVVSEIKEHLKRSTTFFFPFFVVQCRFC